MTPPKGEVKPLRRALKKIAAGTLIALLTVGALEAILRLTGAVARPSVPPSPVLFQQEAPFRQANHLGFIHCGGDASRACLKAAPGLRVLVLGGSAAAGTPFSPYASFSGWLQRYLVRLAGGAPVEVINTSRIGRSSAQVLATLRGELVNLKPDLVIIYSGNNEFYSLLARKLLLKTYSPETELLRHKLWGVHAYRLLSRLQAPAVPLKDDTVGIDERTFDVPVTAADHKLAGIIYRNNLASMAQAAAAHGARILLATVGTNQLYSPLFGPEIRGPKEGLRQLKEAIQKDEGPKQLQRIAAEHQMDLQSHEGHYQLGMLYHGAGDMKKARLHLHLAEVLDPSPQRCTEPLRQALKAESKAGGIPMCDTAAAVARQAPGGIPGDEMYADSCHPSRWGHRLIARALIECIIRQGLLELPVNQSAEVARGLAMAEVSATDLWRLDGSLLSDPHSLRKGQAARPGNPGWHTAQAMELFRDFTVNTGGDRLRLNRALEHLQAALDAGGPVGPLTLNLGLAQLYSQESAKALPLLKQAAKLMPKDPDVRNHAMVVGAIKP